jgi:hypothetical protein
MVLVKSELYVVKTIPAGSYFERLHAKNGKITQSFDFAQDAKKFSNIAELHQTSPKERNSTQPSLFGNVDNNQWLQKCWVKI